MSAKSMWMGMLASIIIAIGAGVILNATGETTKERFATDNVRVK